MLEFKVKYRGEVTVYARSEKEAHARWKEAAYIDDHHENEVVTDSVECIGILDDDLCEEFIGVD